MSDFKNICGERVLVVFKGSRVVEPGEVIHVDDADDESYASNTRYWEKVETDSPPAPEASAAETPANSSVSDAEAELAKAQADLAAAQAANKEGN